MAGTLAGQPHGPRRRGVSTGAERYGVPADALRPPTRLPARRVLRWVPELRRDAPQRRRRGLDQGSWSVARMRSAMAEAPTDQRPGPAPRHRGRESSPAPRLRARASPSAASRTPGWSAACAAASRGAFDAIFDRYHRPLLSFCRHMLGSREEAEDALQQVFVSAHRQPARRRRRGRPAAVALRDRPQPLPLGPAGPPRRRRPRRRSRTGRRRPRARRRGAAAPGPPRHARRPRAAARRPARRARPLRARGASATTRSPWRSASAGTR